jgi:putative N6-adenine-specific DNA methylase
VFNITVKTFQGLESVLAEELKALGAADVKILKRAVGCKGDKELVYKINYNARTALRVLIFVDAFNAKNPDQLYRNIKRIDWSKYMDVDETFAVDSVVSSSVFKHSKYVALKTKDAIVDQFRDKFFKRPSVNTVTPHLRVNVMVHQEKFIVSIDTSGDSLHKRGYRKEGYLAPLNEALAAGLILLTGWKGDKPFVDPMCGSGTLLAEAALIATDTPPQINRDYYAFKKSRDFDEALWNKVVSESNAKIKTPEFPIFGFDKAFQAVRIAERNLDNAGMKDVVTLKRKPFERNEAPTEEGMMVMNPPYGERIETSEDIFLFYQMLGDKMKNDFKGYTAWVITSNIEALKLVGLRASKKMLLFNGALQCKYHGYELY